MSRLIHQQVFVVFEDAGAPRFNLIVMIWACLQLIGSES